MNAMQMLQKGLEDECRKLNSGESVRISIGPQADANAVHAIRIIVEDLYRSMFQEDLHIEEMSRDAYGVLHISVGKKEPE